MPLSLPRPCPDPIPRLTFPGGDNGVELTIVGQVGSFYLSKLDDTELLLKAFLCLTDSDPYDDGLVVRKLT